MIIKNKNKKKYKKLLIKIYYKKMKLETLQGKPKRKYVRKSKENEMETTLNNYIINTTNIVEDEIMNNSNDDNNNDNNDIINELDNEINENLSKCVKKMKLNNENKDVFNFEKKELEIKKAELKKEIKQIDIIQNNIEILSTLNRSKATLIDKVYYNPNVINVKDYEFMSPINVYLYYVSEQIGKNVKKYIIYTHIYKHIDHHILCPTNKPNDYNVIDSSIKKEEIIILAPNITLYVREYNQTKRNYTYENCNKALNKKRKKEVLENGFDYDFCQLHIEGLEYKHKNSYIFEHENKYFSFLYDI